MFLQILVERKFESGIESGEIAVCCIKVKEMVCNQMVLPEFFAIDWYWPQNISKIMLAGKCPYQTDDALRSSVFNQYVFVYHVDFILPSIFTVIVKRS